jgi:hypothetical protein
MLCWSDRARTGLGDIRALTDVVWGDRRRLLVRNNATDSARQNLKNDEAQTAMNGSARVLNQFFSILDQL